MAFAVVASWVQERTLQTRPAGELNVRPAEAIRANASRGPESASAVSGGLFARKGDAMLRRMPHLLVAAVAFALPGCS